MFQINFRGFKNPGRRTSTPRTPPLTGLGTRRGTSNESSPLLLCDRARTVVLTRTKVGDLRDDVSRRVLPTEERIRVHESGGGDLRPGPRSPRPPKESRWGWGRRRESESPWSKDGGEDPEQTEGDRRRRQDFEVQTFSTRRTSRTSGRSPKTSTTNWVGEPLLPVHVPTSSLDPHLGVGQIS